MSYRWTTGNQWTTYSAVYPDAFGQAIAFAETMRRKVLPQDHDQIAEYADFFSELLANFFLPSKEERLELAEDAIASCVHSDC